MKKKETPEFDFRGANGTPLPATKNAEWFSFFSVADSFMHPFFIPLPCSFKLSIYESGLRASKLASQTTWSASSSKAVFHIKVIKFMGKSKSIGLVASHV